MGGRLSSSSRTTEKIQEDGTSTYSFDLKYSTDRACAINLGSSVIITGGVNTLTTVSQYNEAGWVRYLPGLLQGRKYHGCSYYNKDDGTKVSIM